MTGEVDFAAEEAYRQWAVRARALGRLRSTLDEAPVPLDFALVESIGRLERSALIWWLEYLWACS